MAARAASSPAARKPRASSTARAYEAFRQFLQDVGVDPTHDGWQGVPPNVLAAFYRWALDHRKAGLAERTATSYAYAISALLRQLLVDEQLPSSISLEKLRLGLRQSLCRGDYARRKVDPRIDAYIAWVAARPIPPESTDNAARLIALRDRALVLTLYGSGLPRDEVTALQIAEVLRGARPGEADVRGKGDRERTVFLDPTAVAAIRDYIRARGPSDRRPWVFVSHGNRRRRTDRLSPWTIWATVKQLARDAEAADPEFLGLPQALHTHDTRHHFARTVLKNGATLSVVQDLLGHASPDTTKRDLRHLRPRSAAGRGPGPCATIERHFACLTTQVRCSCSGLASATPSKPGSRGTRSICWRRTPTLHSRLFGTPSRPGEHAAVRN